jgi:hypothetical protein
MKKFISKIVASAILVTMFSTLFCFRTTSVANAATISDFTVNVETVDALPNKDITVPIIFENVPDSGILTLNMTINYDPTKLEYLSCKPGSIVPSPDINFATNKKSDGEIKILFLDYTPTFKENIQSSGLFADLTFKVLGSPSESPSINLSEVYFADKELKALNASVINGNVNILEALPARYTISGYVTSDYSIAYSVNEQKTQAFSKEGFKVELIGSTLSALTDANGYFEIKNVPAGTYTAKVTKTNYLARQIKDITIEKDTALSSKTNPILLYIGDLEVNGKQDGVINISDILEICKFFNSVSGDEKYQEKLDLNKDGAINIEEIILISKNFNMTSSKYR